MNSYIRINFALFLTVLSLQLQNTVCFSPGHSLSNSNRVQTTIENASSGRESTSTQLGLFGGLFGKKEEPENQDPSVPKRLFEIPCASLKLGGCRFALGLFLIGQQGTPVKGTWKANQANDGVLDMFHTDNTAMFSVIMTETSIAVDRYGLTPSLPYQLQESLILHRLLDEIQTLALEGEEIDAENRLIAFTDDETAISDARATLPARAEE